MSSPAAADFDRQSQVVAAAYAAGDLRTAQRAADALCASLLLPRLQRLSYIRGYRRELREDVVAHALLRIVGDWRRGKTVTWPTLERIFVNAAVDVTRRADKVPTADVTIDDEDARESFYAAQGADTAGDGGLDAALDAIEVEQLALEFERLRRPRWAAYIRAWHEGYQSGPDIELATGIKAGRARQIRMDVCQYLRAYQPHLAPWFGCQPVRAEGAT